VALAAVDAVVDRLDPERVREVAAALELHGRMQMIGGEPPTILDAAHNPPGAQALGEALAELAAERPVVGCLAVLADKDVAGLVGALAPCLAALVATEVPAQRLAQAGRPGARALPAAELEEVARAAGIERVERMDDPRFPANWKIRRIDYGRAGLAWRRPNTDGRRAERQTTPADPTRRFLPRAPHIPSADAGVATPTAATPCCPSTIHPCRPLTAVPATPPMNR